ncbi:hypothetical protein K501DRAFT_330188 [Backusella circina FSU 941]|nr:hypothetical protein K501DRAFT_330188 [Backusella circina FSU 941]
MVKIGILIRSIVFFIYRFFIVVMELYRHLKTSVLTKFSAEHQSVCDENAALKKQLEKALRDNDALALENKKLIQKNHELEEEINQSNEEQLEIEKMFDGIVDKINARNRVIRQHQLTINFLEKDKRELQAQVKKRDQNGPLISNITLSEIQDKLDHMENSFCMNKNHAWTDHYKVLLKKVAVARSKDWSEIVNAMVHEYSSAKCRIKKSIEELEKVTEKGDKATLLYEIIETERKDKESIWKLLDLQLTNMNKLGLELYESQEQVIELENRNEFLRETCRVFRKRKREEDDDDNEGSSRSKT